MTKKPIGKQCSVCGFYAPDKPENWGDGVTWPRTMCAECIKRAIATDQRNSHKGEFNRDKG
jgi:hypothetical protein